MKWRQQTISDGLTDYSSDFEGGFTEIESHEDHFTGSIFYNTPSYQITLEYQNFDTLKEAKTTLTQAVHNLLQGILPKLTT